MTKPQSDKTANQPFVPADAPAVAVVVLTAGFGTRMQSALPKVLHKIAGRPMIQHLLDAVAGQQPDRVIVIVGEDNDGVAEAVRPHATAVQHQRLGTGHAVMQAREGLAGFDGDVLVLFGADPLISGETMARMRARRNAEDHPAVVVLGFRPDDPGLYGRLVTGDDGDLLEIVEAGDADAATLEIGLCNSGVMAIDGARLFDLLDDVGNDNAKGEYYLTDIVAAAKAAGHACAVIEGDPDELIGIDTRADLARAEALLQDQLRTKAMAGGATLLDPATVYFSHDTALGRDVTVGPNVVFGPGVTVGDGVEIRAFCHFEGAEVADGAIIGPFARLRPGAKIGDAVHIGNFVEIKNADVEAGAKINHLSYVGDSRVGAGANVGAGTITCNYDGFAKHRTEIGAGAFIGSNTALVAPVRIGDGAITGAGSVISKDVADNALAVTRAPQKQLDGWATKFRDINRKQKD